MKGDAEASMAIALAARPLFAGKSPQVQAGALADLVAMWIAGHVVRDDPEATETLREELLAEHIKVVRQLIPVNFAMYVEPKLKDRQ